MNRVLTYGDKASIKEEVLNAVKGVSDFIEWFEAWSTIAQVAEKEGRFLHAAYYYRMAEFLRKQKAENNIVKSGIICWRWIILLIG